MKITITIKDPDGFYDSIRDCAKKEAREKYPELYLKTEDDKLAQREFNELVKELIKEIEAKLEKWVRFSEYATLEFDLEAKTAIVKPVNS